MLASEFGNSPPPGVPLAIYEAAQRAEADRKRAQIEVAIDYGLSQERLSFRTGVRRQTLVPEKWDRIVYNAENYLRRQGILRPY